MNATAAAAVSRPARAPHVHLDLVRCIAAVVVTNSHMDNMYADPRFATGGGLGNALFFFLSGYGLMASWLQTGPAPYAAWVLRRGLRLYLPVWLFIAVLAVVGAGPTRWSDVVWFTLWPTPYWFVSAIFAFYLVFPLVLRLSAMRLSLLLVAIAVVYLGWYLIALDLRRFAIEDQYFSWVFYFGTMLLGALAAHPTLRLRLVQWMAQRGVAALVLLACLAAYFACKLAFSRGLAHEQQWVLHALTLPIVLATVAVAGRLQALPAGWPGRLVGLVSAMTLEVYLVQVFMLKAQWLRAGVDIVGPALAWACVFVAAWVLHRAGTALLKRLPVGRRAPNLGLQ